MKDENANGWQPPTSENPPSRSSGESPSFNQSEAFEQARADQPSANQPGTSGSAPNNPSNTQAPNYPAFNAGAAHYGSPASPQYPDAHNQPPGPHFAQRQIKPGPITLRPWSASEIISGAFAIIRFTPRVTFAVTTIIALIAFVVEFIVQSNIDYTLVPANTDGVNYFFDTQFLVLQVLVALAYTLGSAPLTIIAMQALVGKKISVRDATKTALQNIWQYLLAAVIIFVVSTLGVVLAVAVPLLISGSGFNSIATAVFLILIFQVALFLISIRFILAFPAVLVESKTATAALARSWNLSRGRYWQLLGRILLAGLLIFAIATAVGVLNAVLSTILILFQGLILLPFVSALGSAVMFLLLTPIYGYAVTLLYVDTRIRKEGYDLELARNGEVFSTRETATRREPH